jgi:hypothetical protein
MTTQIKFKWFWLWEDEKEEAWLRDMAKQGFKLQSIRPLNGYVFESDTPLDMAYRLDFIIPRKDYQEYLQLFRDAGWEHVLVHGGWQYFRKESADGIAPEIFTDNHSKIMKYQSLAIFLVIFMLLWRPTAESFENVTRYGAVTLALLVPRLLVILALIISVIMLVRRILQLRKNINSSYTSANRFP